MVILASLRISPSLTLSLVDSVFYCAKFAGEVFKKQGTGNLIITSSISAHIVNVPIDQPVGGGLML
jgi:hypothetical protein